MKTAVSITLAIAAMTGSIALAQEVQNPVAPPSATVAAPPAPVTPPPPPQPVTPAPDYDANGVYQVFRVTDNQLNCTQLISEMNTLNATIKDQTEQQARQQSNGRAGRQAAGGILGGALGGFARGQIARNVPGLGYSGALAAAGATDAASAAVGSAVANSGDQGGPAATQSDEQQRLNRVSQLFASKGC